MQFKKCLVVTITALLIFIVASSFAQAWPELPPVKALISGPGLQGQVQITDTNLLKSLKLGALEDFSKGALAAPNVKTEPYKIIRYFEDGTFQMGDLSYYPATNNTASVVYFQDGPMKNGDRSPYNNQWYSTIASSDQLLQQFIRAQSGASNILNTPTARSVWLARNVGATHQTIAFDTATNAPRFVLPNGLRSADGSAYWAEFQAGDTTALHSFDVTNGTIRASLGLQGNWGLGAISASGKWLALKRTPSVGEQAEWNKTKAWKTTVALIDTTTRKTTRTISLNGNFDVDALNASGTVLYLIEHLPGVKPDRYQVRAFDLAPGTLRKGALVDKREIDQVMAGYPTDSIASPNGEWLFKLYVGMQEGHAFLHALNLKDGYAWYIDLPSGDGDPATLEKYSLALAPDGNTIYAGNAALGVLASANVMQIGEPRVVKFTPVAKAAEGASLHSALVTPDGKNVFVSDGGLLWQYDAVKNRVQELERTLTPIVALGVDATADKLLIAQADHSISTVPLKSGITQATDFSSEQNKSGCDATLATDYTFVAPFPYPESAPYGQFWHGNEKLWVALRPNGKWLQLGYGEKVFWWSQGYVGSGETEPALKVTGKRLDTNGAPIVLSEDATNAFHKDFGGWAMLTGIKVPELGCWEITAEYKGETLSFVVDVTP